MFKFEKKGISTLVSTVLLIVFIVTLGAIVIGWTNKIVGKGIDKSESRLGTNLECGDINVRLDKGVNEGEIFVKNNNDFVIQGFIARLITNQGNVLVDYTNSEEEISGFDVFIADYSGDYKVVDVQGEESASINYANELEMIEIIPRVIIESGIVDCEMKKIKWEKF